MTRIEAPLVTPPARVAHTVAEVELALVETAVDEDTVTRHIAAARAAGATHRQVRAAWNRRRCTQVYRP